MCSEVQPHSDSRCSLQSVITCMQAAGWDVTSQQLLLLCFIWFRFVLFFLLSLVDDSVRLFGVRESQREKNSRFHSRSTTIVSFCRESRYEISWLRSKCDHLSNLVSIQNKFWSLWRSWVWIQLGAFLCGILMFYPCLFDFSPCNLVSCWDCWDRLQHPSWLWPRQSGSYQKMNKWSLYYSCVDPWPLCMSSYGYRGRDCRSNLYLLPTGETVYFIASVVVLFNVDEQLQRHYTGHTDDIKWWGTQALTRGTTSTCSQLQLVSHLPLPFHRIPLCDEVDVRGFLNLCSNSWTHPYPFEKKIIVRFTPHHQNPKKTSLSYPTPSPTPISADRSTEYHIHPLSSSQPVAHLYSHSPFDV